MGLQRRLLDEQIMLKMYMNLAKLYGNRTHDNALRGTYEDPLYGRYQMSDVKRHVFLVKGLNIDINVAGNNIQIDIELSTNTANLSL